MRYGDKTDIAFLAAGIAAGLLVGLFSVKFGSFALTLGGAGGALLAGLVCGWLRSRRPTVGSFPPAAQQTLSDIGLGGFIAAIGLANGPAALAAIQAHGLLLLGMGVVVTLGSADRRHPCGASHPAHEPDHHLRCARRRDDGGCRGHRMLRTRRQPDAGARRRRALCGRKRAFDRPRPGHRDASPLPDELRPGLH